MEEAAQIIKKRQADSYVAIDLETTGLDPKQDKIIEIGAVRVEQGSITTRWSSLVNPRRELLACTKELTGITDLMVGQAPDLSDCFSELYGFIGDLPLLGHHIIFDYSFLKRAAVNQGLPFEREGIDTLPLCRRFMPPEEKKNLAAACRYYGIGQQEAHRALADAISAHLLYEELRKQYGETDPEAFSARPLIYKVKKEQPASKRQKEVLRDLIKYHKINLTVQIDYLSRNEASRMTDKIISQYGRIKEVTIHV